MVKKDVSLKNSDKVKTIYFFANVSNDPKSTPRSKVPDGKVVSEAKAEMLVLENTK